MTPCLGCYTAIPDDQEFCKTCADRRKVLIEPKLSDPSELAPSQGFEGFTDPFSGEVLR